MFQKAANHPLTAWRMAAGLSMQKAAALIPCTRQCWRDWERGHRIPNRAMMPRVCEISGLVPNDFYSIERQAA
ncbi:MAG: helix-turn-helix domain-containing protein [Sphingomonas oligoaromativorans]